MNSRRENKKPFSSGENRTENPPAGSLAIDQVIKSTSELELRVEWFRLLHQLGVIVNKKRL
jgi:hypothetical protein